MDTDTNTDTGIDIDIADIGISSWFCFSGEPWLIQAPDTEVVPDQGPEVSTGHLGWKPREGLTPAFLRMPFPGFEGPLPLSHLSLCFMTYERESLGGEHERVAALETWGQPGKSKLQNLWLQLSVDKTSCWCRWQQQPCSPCGHQVGGS